MQPGAKVRFLRGKEEGIVRSIKNGNIVEVEIEDGFVIPVLKSELVVISEDEHSSFQTRESINETITPDNGGIYIAYLPFNDRIFHLYLISEIAEDVLFTVHEQEGEKFKGIGSGSLKINSIVKVADCDMATFDHWNPLVFQMIFLNHQEKELKNPFIKKLNPKASAFYKSKKKIPIINKEGYVFRLDEQKVFIDANQLKEALNEHKESERVQLEILAPPSEIDLHIEKLTNSYDAMTSGEKLELQLKIFQENIERAIASGMKEIVIIHGIGNGTLKNSIRKNLKNYNQVKSFSDANPGKFGYGATQIKFN
ncbi:MAG: Smr/MutS family protein [Cytophagaceae bacterium]